MFATNEMIQGFVAAHVVAAVNVSDDEALKAARSTAPVDLDNQPAFTDDSLLRWTRAATNYAREQQAQRNKKSKG